MVRVDGVATEMTAGFRTSELRESSGTDLHERVADDGYAFVRGLLDPEQVLALRRRVVAVCAGLGWLDGDGVAREDVRLGAYDHHWVTLQGEMAKTPELAALGADPAIFGLMERILGGPVRGGVGSVCRVMSPTAGDLTTPPHQDRRFIEHENAFWTIWIPLGDCPRCLGGLAVLPRSHHAGLREHGDGHTADVPEDAVWATADYACGDALAFHCLTVHRACPNVTRDRVRVSADFRYEPARRPKAGASSTFDPKISPRTTGPTGT
jgi:ectoine hydroxylase-related dioxygenase (phytanoyl-CoA dioxygenase family)